MRGAAWGMSKGREGGRHQIQNINISIHPRMSEVTLAGVKTCVSCMNRNSFSIWSIRQLWDDGATQGFSPTVFTSLPPTCRNKVPQLKSSVHRAIQMPPQHPDWPLRDLLISINPTSRAKGAPRVSLTRCLVSFRHLNNLVRVRKRAYFSSKHTISHLCMFQWNKEILCVLQCDTDG